MMPKAELFCYLYDQMGSLEDLSIVKIHCSPTLCRILSLDSNKLTDTVVFTLKVDDTFSFSVLSFSVNIYIHIMYFDLIN